MTKPRSELHRSGTVSITDISHYCQVSTSTVSLALRHDSRVAPATAQRILAAAETLGYVPNPAARRLVMKRYAERVDNHLAALSLPLNFYRVRFFMDIFYGLMETLVAHGYDLLTMGHNTGSQEEASSLLGITKREVDGLITYSPNTNAELLNRLRSHPGFRNRPIVTMMGNFDDFLSVQVDDGHGAFLAATHLIAQGHRHILTFVYAEQEDRSMRRTAEIRRAMRDAGIDPEHHLHIRKSPIGWQDPKPFQGGQNTRESHVIRMQQADAQELLAFIKDHPEITALITLNDAVALNCWYALSEAGMHLPDDMSIIGFDDTDPLLDEQGVNMLTTIRLPLVEVGRQSAQLFMQGVQGIVENKNVMLPVELIERHSTAPAAR